MKSNMTLTSVFLGDAERRALAQLARVTGKNRSECMRVAIREAAAIVKNTSAIRKIVKAQRRVPKRAAAICKRKGYQIRGADNVLRCDSGDFKEDKAGILRCVHCELRAA